MKKVLIASGVAILAFAMVAGAQTTFSSYLTVGSRGAQVEVLQTWLIQNGFSIPAIESGAAAKGYFGAQTKTAVAAYQKSVGLPNTGYFGPMTIAKINGGAVAVNPGSVTCPVGYTCTANPGTTPAPVTTTVGLDNTDGSVTVAASSYVSASQTLKKGDMDKPIIAVNAQATAGKVAVTRLDVHFNSRPWLLFGQLKLKDATTGTILTTKALTSAADVTEVTVNSDYMVRFSGINVVVTPGTITTLVVSADVLTASDKITGQTVTVSTDANSVRTVNGLGITDSTGVAQSNSVTLSSTGSTADLNSRVSPSTPDATTLNISSTNVTPDVTLGVFDVKVVNQGATLSAMNFTIQNNKGSATVTAAKLFQNVRLYSGTTLLGGATTFSGDTATFTNLSIPLTVESWKSLTLKADVVATTTTSFAASSTIDVSTIVGVDTNYNTVTLTNASDRTSNDTTFVVNAGITVSGITVNKGSVTTPTTGIWSVAYPTIAFTITNTGNNSIYISKTPGTALATTTSSGPNASTTATVTASSPTTGDTATSYIINGTRTFTYSFTVDNTNGTTAAKKINITQINYGTAGTAGNDNTLNVNYGLETAAVQVP
jgi:hypothetical protein